MADADACRIAAPYSCLLKADTAQAKGQCTLLDPTDPLKIARARDSDVCLSANQGPAVRCA
jgi:hypothetical protein